MTKRTLNRLSARGVSRPLAAGRYADGGGLYLVVTDKNARKWIFRYANNGRQRDMGLGAERDVSLAEARDAATRCRAHLRAGLDPIAERERERAVARRVPTFGELADELVASIEGSFRSAQHRGQWRTTLRTHAKSLRPKPVDTVNTEDVLEVLTPIWLTKAETASRLRGRIERVIDVAKAKGYRTAENPARWRGHLDSLLPRRPKLSRGHHAALPFEDISEFSSHLRNTDSIPARALEFLILTAARSGEVLGMRWGEVSADGQTWVIPAGRMKAGREHRVPLCPRASEILALVGRGESWHFVFHGDRAAKPQAHDALLKELRHYETVATVHGFRSSFRDWVGECTNFPRELAEISLAHSVGDSTERAYRRGDALEKRRELMNAWANYCSSTNNIIALRAG